MQEKQILAAACARVNCTLGQVLAYHIYEDRITLVVDRGIAGGPKYTVPLAELEERQSKPPEVEVEVDATPSARRLAEELDVELAMVTGSGGRGRILKRDVEGYHD